MGRSLLPMETDRAELDRLLDGEREPEAVARLRGE